MGFALLGLLLIGAAVGHLVTIANLIWLAGFAIDSQSWIDQIVERIVRNLVRSQWDWFLSTFNYHNHCCVQWPWTLVLGLQGPRLASFGDCFVHQLGVYYRSHLLAIWTEAVEPRSVRVRGSVTYTAGLAYWSFGQGPLSNDSVKNIHHTRWGPPSDVRWFIFTPWTLYSSICHDWYITNNNSYSTFPWYQLYPNIIPIQWYIMISLP